MKPIYEAIKVAHNTSLKVATYTHSLKCESVGWHIHPEYELVYIKNGKGLLHIDTVTIPYDDGALVFLGPNIPHSDFGNKEYKDNMEVVLQFDKEFVEDKIAVFPELKAVKNLVKNSRKVLLFNKSTKEEMAEEFEKLADLNAASRLINFMDILEKLSRSRSYKMVFNAYSPVSHKRTDVERLEAIFEYVNTHYNEPISTRVVAKRMGLTTNSFCRFFKKMTNKSFIPFLNEFRTGKALELFNEESHSISEVMYRCGYSDASYFTRQFKKIQGITPSGYLQSVA